MLQKNFAAELVSAGATTSAADLAKRLVGRKLGVTYAERTALAAPSGELKQIKDAIGFLLDVSQHKPGDTIEILLADQRKVKVPLGRGVEFRSPLFSLFVTEKLDWIGPGSPAGPYESRGTASEVLLGWLTNTAIRHLPRLMRGPRFTAKTIGVKASCVT